MSQEIKNSKVISTSVPFHKEKKHSFKGGKWEKDEHHKFIEGLFIYGNQWKKMSQKFIVKIKNKYIELYVKEELLGDNYELKANNILSLLSNEFECDFITNFCKRIEQLEGNRDYKLISFLQMKKQNFVNTILNLMNTSPIKSNASRKNAISENVHSPISISSLPTEFETEDKNNEKFINEYYKENTEDD